MDDGSIQFRESPCCSWRRDRELSEFFTHFFLGRKLFWHEGVNVQRASNLILFSYLITFNSYLWKMRKIHLSSLKIQPSMFPLSTNNKKIAANFAQSRCKIDFLKRIERKTRTRKKRQSRNEHLTSGVCLCSFIFSRSPFVGFATWRSATEQRWLSVWLYLQWYLQRPHSNGEK